VTESVDQPSIYTVRPSARAADQIEAEHSRLEGTAGASIADAWEDALMDAIASLATYPERCAIANENKLFQCISPGDTLRVLLFRRTRTGPAWRILFSAHETDENDPLTVRVHHIRHGAQAPMTEWPADHE
jgi:plasmid stabilization system protein ParE